MASSRVTYDWMLLAPLAAATMLALTAVLGERPWILAGAAATLVAAVLAAVHHAEVFAHRVGEPFGTLVLALAVSVIEAALLLSLLVAGGTGMETLPRDTVYATVMIITTGVVGLCTMVGGIAHREQSFRVEGAGGALAALIVLAVVTLVLPDFTITTSAGTYSHAQSLFAAVVSAALWGIFVFVQTIRHRDYFLPPDDARPDAHAAPPSRRRAALSFVLLVVALVSVVVVLARGNDIFETEFRGGVSMTLSTRPAAAGEPQAVDGHLGLTRQAVEDRVREIGKNAGDDKIVAQLANANVLTVGQETKDGLASSFQIRVGNPPSMDSADESRISRDVQEAVVVGFAKDLDVRLPLEFTNSESGDHTPVTRPLEKALVGSSIGRPNASSEPVGEFRGGVAIVIDGLKTPITAADAAERIRRMRSQPDWSSTAGRPTKVLGLEAADPANPTGPQKALVVLVNDAEINATKVDLETWDRNLASKEWDLVRQALTQQASLDQVSSFSPVVAENLAASAVVAVVLSLIGMLAYIWVRFGSFRFSTATVVGVTFNVIVCLGFLAISIPVAQTGFGAALYIEQYRIDLNVVAGLLTIIGYSLNDTIVILDRVRENRGKRAWISRETVNLAINQTFSRTVLTGGSTLATAIILISLGGTGIRPFAYTFLIGLIAGTFSSVAIAAPLVYSRREEEIERAKAAITPTSKTSGPAAQPA